MNFYRTLKMCTTHCKHDPFLVCRSAILLAAVIGLLGCQKAVQENFSQQLQNSLDTSVKSQKLIGATAAVIVPGEDSWQGASGFSDPANSVTMKPTMLLCMGSITKSFTAAMVLRLAEAHILTLEDRIDRWLDSYANIDGAITLRQLLTHTSGLYNYTDHPTYVASMRSDLNKSWSPEELLQRFVDSPHFSPGTSYEYSNTNYLLLGMIIKKATAQALAAYLRPTLLTPLGLNSIFLQNEEAARGEIAHDWVDIDGDDVLDDTAPFVKTSFYSAVWSAGALFSNASDLATWLKSLFEGRVLTQSSLNEMLAFTPQSNQQYGMAIAKVTLRGKELWGHDGGILGFSALALYEPSTKISIAILVNQNTDANPATVGIVMLSLLDTALARINK